MKVRDPTSIRLIVALGFELIVPKHEILPISWWPSCTVQCVFICPSHNARGLKSHELCTMLLQPPSSPCFCGCYLPAVNEHLGFILVRVSVAPPLLPIWIFFTPSSSLTPSLSDSRCIHFCAFKKSPRFPNLEESELTGATEEEG